MLRNRVALAPPLIHVGNTEVGDDKTVAGTALNISGVYSAIEPSLNATVCRHLEFDM